MASFFLRKQISKCYWYSALYLNQKAISAFIPRYQSSGGERASLEKRNLEWLHWTESTKEIAKKQNKLLFMSIGRNLVETRGIDRICSNDKQLVEFMNENLLLIKVDKDERPDLDNFFTLFMIFALNEKKLTYPRNIWLTPDLNPLNAHGLCSTDQFRQVVYRSVQLWKDQSSTLSMQSEKNVELFLKRLEFMSKKTDVTSPDPVLLSEKLISQLVDAFDIDAKIFSGNFLPPFYLHALLNCSKFTKDPTTSKLAIELVKQALSAMIYSPVYDQVNSGFHSSSLDSSWKMPKFEKLLYDQCQMVKLLLHAFCVTQNSLYSDIATKLLNYLKIWLKHPSGGYCAMEFDYSGFAYTWSWEEIQSAFDSETELNIFSEYYSCTTNGNIDLSKYQRVGEVNALSPVSEKIEFAESKNMTISELDKVLNTGLLHLAEIGRQKSCVVTDQRYITAWNCMMISTLALAGKVLNQDEYFKEAESCLNFIRDKVYDKRSKSLSRMIDMEEENNEARLKLPEQVEDYAALIQALIDLTMFSKNGADHWNWIEELQEVQDRLFWDKANGGYFASLYDDPTIITRLKPAFETCNYVNPNSISGLNLLRLHRHLNKAIYKDRAETLYNRYIPNFANMPIGMPAMISTYVCNSHDIDFNDMTFMI